MENNSTITDADNRNSNLTTFSKNVESEKYQKLIQYWSPPVGKWKSIFKEPNFNLHIACIAEDRLYNGLRFEAKVTSLDDKNWQNALEAEAIDMLVMESIWGTSTGHWHMAQNPSSPERQELLNMIFLSQKLSIPTVFWITKGHEYHEHFKDFARYFDYVFCSDPIEAEMLRAEGCKAEILLPCVQPALYNPFRVYDDKNEFKLDIVFDGWADIDRLYDNLTILKEIKKFGLSIIESRYKIFHNRINLFPDFRDCIKGCVKEQSKIDLLKYAGIYLTSDYSLSNNVSKQWMTLEAAASRLPIVHYGSLADNDFRIKIVNQFSDSENLIHEIEQMQNEYIYREQKAHKGWREAYQNHTYSHRLNSICKFAGITHNWEEFPEITIVSPTYRENRLEGCMDAYKRQTYPNKKNIIVFNENREIPKSFKKKIENNDHVKIIGIPKELFTGSCMNLGIHFSDSKFFFKMDDDDIYGNNYIMDMMLYNKAVNADIICKPNSSFYKFEDNNNIYIKKDTLGRHTINHLPQNAIFKRYLVAGNSISIMSEAAKTIKFEDFSYGAADASYIYKAASSNLNIFSVDRLNIIINRRNDSSSHTWKENKLSVMEGFDLISEQYKDVLI